MLRTFELDPQLAADTFEVTDLGVTSVRLMNDARWPWLILVPRISGVEELFDLSPSQQEEAMREASTAGQKLQAVTSCTKINIAMLGNMVRQLHIHVIARVEGDANWPGPVWGHGARQPYEQDRSRALIAHLRSVL